MKNILILSIITFFSVIQSTFAQQQKTATKESLNKEILNMDRLLFDEAFNKCNLELFTQLLDSNIEFYDDRSGLNTSIEKEITSFKDKCSKPFKVTRKLVNSEVSVLGNYGAVQTGTHEFYVDQKKVERAKFITIWERKNDTWLVKRAISYQHKSVEDEH